MGCRFSRKVPKVIVLSVQPVSHATNAAMCICLPRGCLGPAGYVDTVLNVSFFRPKYLVVARLSISRLTIGSGDRRDSFCGGPAPQGKEGATLGFVFSTFNGHVFPSEVVR